MLQQFAAGRHAAHVQIEPVGARLFAVVAQQRPGEVEQRIADRRHLPVHDRGQSRRLPVREHHVGELVVAVHDARLVVRGPVAAQPVGGLVQAGKVAHLVGVEEGQPAVDLPFVESVRAAEALEALGAPVHPAQLGGALDQLERQAAPGLQVGVERRLPPAVHRAPPVDRLHDVERHAQHGAGVVGGDQRRVRDVGAGQRAHQPDLAQQAVDAGGVGARTGHPQHHALAAALDQVQGVL